MTRNHLEVRREDCMVCGGSEFRAVCDKGGSKYVCCAACGVVRQFPYPTDQEIAHYYTNYVTKKATDSVYLTDAGFAVFKRDKELTFGDLGMDESAFAGKAILDVGCGTGQFVRMMQARGSSVLGMDISDECIAEARARGLNCIQGDFLSVEGTRDVISMWHLVEHLLRPRMFVEHANRLLNPGGWLLIETPVIGSISASFGEHWRYFMPVEHLNLFTQNALFRMCVEVGFRVESWIRFGSGNDDGSVPAPNKHAMDIIAKKHGFGDTIAVLFIK